MNEGCLILAISSRDGYSKRRPTPSIVCLYPRVTSEELAGMTIVFLFVGAWTFRWD